MLMKAKKTFKWSLSGNVKEYIAGEVFEVNEKCAHKMVANNYAIRHEEKMNKTKPENKQYNPKEENKSDKRLRTRKKKIENIEEENSNKEVENE
jgi:hypothetical protein